MVDLGQLPAFVENKHQKANITEVDQCFNPSKRRFDEAYNTARVDERLRQEATFMP